MFLHPILSQLIHIHAGEFWNRFQGPCHLEQFFCSFRVIQICELVFCSVLDIFWFLSFHFSRSLFRRFSFIFERLCMCDLIAFKVSHFFHFSVAVYFFFLKIHRTFRLDQVCMSWLFRTSCSTLRCRGSFCLYFGFVRVLSGTVHIPRVWNFPKNTLFSWTLWFFRVPLIWDICLVSLILESCRWIQTLFLQIR